ncbi:hypothetical protein MSAN_02422400 [Mycena sanguinolenta]|uniref:Uncharacterized protein n=1 Tax=Mycena sanguinolenta TaxID=230812 RepID=A0A8H7CD77_9AGAR|nr:hypothetical protein MSAN_02422400 [Mycena sanguinolenta]
MPSISRAKIFLISTLLGISCVNAGQCGDNGGVELGWGTMAAADANGENVNTALGFKSTGPFDAEGNPILTVIATNAGFDSSFYLFNAWICGQDTVGFQQTNYGAMLGEAGAETSLCLTASAIETSNITLSMQPCVNDISTPPVPTQMFEWNENGDFITYYLVFLGNTTGLPLKETANTDYTPSLVPATNTTGAYIRLDYTPGANAPLTGDVNGIVLELSDD